MSDWSDQIKEIGHDLINIEINTIEAEGMLGRKMPSFPHALIDIAQKYGDYLGGEPVRLNVDAFAKEFAARFAEVDSVADALAQVPTKAMDPTDEDIKEMRAAPVIFTEGPHQYSFSMTNGPNTFEMLRWAARRVLDAAEKGKRLTQGPVDEDDELPSRDLPEPTIAIVRRIYRTCDQIKSIAFQLNRDSEYSRYIPRTRWQLLNSSPPTKTAPPELLGRIRKAWDIGVDKIVLQTVIQLDGDVVFRGAPDVLRTDSPLLKAHEAVTAVGLKHWENLFGIVLQLLSKGVDRLLGSAGDKG